MKRSGNYSVEEKAAAWTQIQVNEGNVKRAASDLGIPYTTLRDWWQVWQREGVPQTIMEHVEKATESFIHRAERIRRTLLDQIEERLETEQGKIPMKDLYTLMGILTDKIDRSRSLKVARSGDNRTQIAINVFSQEDAKDLFNNLVTRAVDAASDRQQVISEVVDEEQSPYKELPETTEDDIYG